MKKILALVMSAALAATVLAGCSSSSGDGKGDEGKEIYFLNFKPEIAEVYEEIAEKYEEETGVKVKVETAAAGTYEATLKAEVEKNDSPTIFQINGPVGYQSWNDYTLDLSDTELYGHLTDKSLAVVDGEGVYGIPYVVEGYGIIYNNAIMSKYFGLTDKAVDITSTEEINNFETLKAVVEDMTKHKEKLGIEGVFASTSLKTGDDWRWQTHLANIPLYYEFSENAEYDTPVSAGLASSTIDFKYSDNYKNIFDLYINNSGTEATMLGSKAVNDSMAEFALGKVAMVQNGNWAWNQISEVDGNTVKEEDIKFMPIYTGMEGEEKQGLAVGTENYFAINSKVSEEKQKMSIEFLEWLFTSDTGKDYVVNKLGFISPFDTFTEDERPSDPLAKEVLAWMDKDLTLVNWTFAAFPSQNFKNDFGAALLEYAQGQKEWKDVVDTVISSWESEYEAANE